MLISWLSSGLQVFGSRMHACLTGWQGVRWGALHCCCWRWCSLAPSSEAASNVNNRHRWWAELKRICIRPHHGMPMFPNRSDTE